MDPRQSTSEFIALLTHLCAQHPKGSASWPPLFSHMHSRVTELLNHPDSAYLPGFKCLDFISATANLGLSIAEETQLRPNEALGLLKNLLADDAEMVKRFRLEAALERARYAPLMLHAEELAEANSHRSALLQKRWVTMREAQQALYTMHTEYLACAERTVAQVIESVEFSSYRIGPLLQMFAEILHEARSASCQQLPLDTLKAALSPSGRLWRSYALKSRRFRDAVPPPAQFDMLTPKVLH